MIRAECRREYWDLRGRQQQETEEKRMRSFTISTSHKILSGRSNQRE
jgi:hypothetical protein